MSSANRLKIDTGALRSNWRAFSRAGAAECGAAVKADGYGLGAPEVVAALAGAGCRDFFVAHWSEVEALGPLPPGARVAVLHGIMPGEMTTALASAAIPVLCTAAQVAAWREAAPSRTCDIMVDTGINRLGLTVGEAMSGVLDGLNIDVLHSHLACADDPASAANREQLAAFMAVAADVPTKRRALCNSAGVSLGVDYHFDLIRPGLGLYGGGLLSGQVLSPVVSVEARIVQLRDVVEGQRIGYGGTFAAERPMRLAVVALGYADGYSRSLSGCGVGDGGDDGDDRGSAVVGGRRCPVAGRVSMDLTAFDVTDAGAPLAEGDWLHVDFDLDRNARAAGRSQYELLTGLGHRYAREYQ